MAKQREKQRKELNFLSKKYTIRKNVQKKDGKRPEYICTDSTNGGVWMNQRGKKRRVNKSNRRGMLAIAGVVAFLLVVVLVQSQKLTVKNNAYQAQKAELEQQIKDEEIRAEDIEKLRDYVDSDEFIEKMARDKLGLVYQDEIIFKAEK